MELLIWFASLFGLIISVRAQQSCLQAAGNNGDLPEFISGGDHIVKITHRHQAIIASYQFQCCGNVTEWGASVETSGRIDDKGGYDINYQVWRPSPAVEIDGCYSMVGQNAFTSVTLFNGLIRETPATNEQISFQPGDVVGFFVQSNRDRDPEQRGVVLDQTYNTETVWYGSVDGGVADNPSCPFPVGSQSNRLLRTSTDQAPIISVSYTTFDYSLMTSPAHPTPTSSKSVVTTSSPTLSPSPTPISIIIGDGQPPTTVQPDQSPVATLPTTSGDLTTSESPPNQPASVSTVLIIGGVVAAISLILIAAVLALIGHFLYKRRKTSEDLVSTSKEDIASISITKMNENKAYIKSTSRICTAIKDAEYEMVDSLRIPQALETTSQDYNYVNEDPFVVTRPNEAYGTSTESFQMSGNEAYGHTSIYH